MDLTTYNEAARVWKQGEQTVVGVQHGTKLKAHFTGDNPQTLLEEGPGRGKQWEVMVRVEIKETDA
jgi:hypothetical protein